MLLSDDNIKIRLNVDFFQARDAGMEERGKDVSTPLFLAPVNLGLACQ